MIQLYVLALLLQDNKVLLLRRASTASFGKGSYSLVGGKVEPDERALHAIKREVFEEVALDIPESSFKLVHTLHRKGTENPFIALCFTVDITKLAKPHNNERDKHDAMKLFPLDQLPPTILPAHKQAIECIRNNVMYSEHGW